MSPKFETEDLTGAFAIGSLTFLGLFFIADHYFNLWCLFEPYTKDNMWTLVLAIPTLVIIYTIGIFNSNITELIFNKLNKTNDKEDINNFIFLTLLNNEALIQKYNHVKRFQFFFQSCTLSLIVLGLGTFMTTKWIAGYEIFAYLFGFGIIIIAFLCPLIAKRYSRQSSTINEFVKRKLVEKTA
jgi:hypothetical protein